LWETEPFMRNIFLVITLLLTLQSCDDGDLIVTTFDFEEIELKQCGIWGDLVFYKINNSTYESLSLQLKTLDSIFYHEDTLTYPIGNSLHRVNYRMYDGSVPESYFCSSVPPITPKIVKDYQSEGGVLTVQTHITDTVTEGDITKYTYTAFFTLHNLKMVSDEEVIIQETLELGAVSQTH
jgi:hypothetical protein